MENDFDYKLVPSSFAHCFNSACPQADSCLRSLAAQQSASGSRYLVIVNPACFPLEGKACTFFKSSRKVRMAWGITRLLDNVPNKEVAAIRQHLISHFTKSHYYRFFRKEYALTPKDQLFVRQLFKQKGIDEEPAFDYYTEEFEWRYEGQVKKYKYR